MKWIQLATICLMMALLAVGVVQSQEEASPLLIGFYGENGAAGALGMQVAVAEINRAGVFRGADGNTYRFIPLVTSDLNLLSRAVVVFVTPDSPPLASPATLSMPVLMLSSDAELSLENLDAQIFRAMSPQTRYYEALADYLERGNLGQNVTLIGTGALAEANFAALVTRLSLAENPFNLRILEDEAPEVGDIIADAPQVVVYFGGQANSVLSELAAQNWQGSFVYEKAYEDIQVGTLSLPTGIQVLGMTSWSNAAENSLSQLFRQTFISQTGKLPSPEDVSAYDLTWASWRLVQRVGADGAQILAALPTTPLISTTQGQIDPANYGGQDLFASVQIYRLQALGGMSVLARYDAGVYLGEFETVASLPTPTPLPTETPSQPTITALSTTLNVRVGPAEQFERFATLRQGDQAVVVGAIPDYSWFYVQTAAGLGWVNAQFVELFNAQGGLNGIPVVQAPPLPTPAPTSIVATPTPLQPADLVIDKVEVVPARPIKGQGFTVVVTVRNAGSSPSGGFTIGGNWLPDNTPVSVEVPSLASFETINAVLNITQNQAGAATSTVTADLNNVVVESNESNNSFNVNYVVDAEPTVSASNSYAVNQLNFAGNFPDIDWTGVSLDAINGATLGLIIGVPFEQVNVSQLKAASINGASVGTLAAGTVFGMRTGQGHCGVFRIDNVVGANITFSFRMYTVADCA